MTKLYSSKSQFVRCLVRTQVLAEAVGFFVGILASLMVSVPVALVSYVVGFNDELVGFIWFLAFVASFVVGWRSWANLLFRRMGIRCPNCNDAVQARVSPRAMLSVANRKCPKCGAHLTPGLCPECGYELEDAESGCRQCQWGHGHLPEIGLIYCRRCLHQLDKLKGTVCPLCGLEYSGDDRANFSTKTDRQNFESAVFTLMVAALFCTIFDVVAWMSPVNLWDVAVVMNALFFLCTGLWLIGSPRPRWSKAVLAAFGIGIILISVSTWRYVVT